MVPRLEGLPFGLPEDLPGGLTPGVLERAWHRAQDNLAKLTPDAVHVIANGSSHYVTLTQLKLVIDQALRLVRAVRSDRPVGSASRSTATGYR